MLSINTHRAAFVALAVLCSALLTGCGQEDPNTLVRETFGGEEKKVDSGRLSVNVSVRAQGSPQLSQPVQVSLSGPFQSQGKRKLPKFDLSLSFSAGGQRLNAGATSTGTAGFVKLMGTAYQVPAQVVNQLQQAYAQAQANAEAERKRRDQSLSALGVDPSRWLRNPRNVGSEEVAGADTEHVAATVDVPRLLQDVNRLLERARAQNLPQAGQLPPAITPEQQQQAARAVRRATFDFWTGKDDRILRKLAITLDLQVPEEERAQAQGVTSGQLSFTLQMAELNEDQRIVAPPNPRPFNELGPALGGLGLGGAGGAPGG